MQIYPLWSSSRELELCSWPSNSISDYSILMWTPRHRVQSAVHRVQSAVQCEYPDQCLTYQCVYTSDHEVYAYLWCGHSAQCVHAVYTHYQHADTVKALWEQLSLANGGKQRVQSLLQHRIKKHHRHSDEVLDPSFYYVMANIPVK